MSTEKPAPSVNPADDGIRIESLKKPTVSPDTPGFAVWLILMVLGFAFLLYLFVVNRETIRTMTVGGFAWVAVEWVGGMVIVTGLIGAFFDQVLWGRRTACPRCRRWWAKVYAGHEVLKRRRCRAVVAADPDMEPNPEDRQTWRKRVPAIRCIAEVFYQCPHCGEKWSDAQTGHVAETRT